MHYNYIYSSFNVTSLVPRPILLVQSRPGNEASFSLEEDGEPRSLEDVELVPGEIQLRGQSICRPVQEKSYSLSLLIS